MDGAPTKRGGPPPPSGGIKAPVKPLKVVSQYAYPQ